MNSELQKLTLAGKITPTDAEKLSKLEPGSACKHKSWGLGRVSEWDLLGDRIIIDFETKTGHPMKLGFAAETLTPLDATHILSRRVTDLPTLQKMAKEKPTEIVELALRSNGNAIFLDDLEKMLNGKIVTTDYKKWWDAAKKELKTARHIVVPTKRVDAMVLRSQDSKPSEQMLKTILGCRDLKGKIQGLAAIVKDIDLFEDPANELQPVFKDISDMVKKSRHLQLKESLNLLLHRDELATNVKATLPEGLLSLPELIREAKPQALAENVNTIPVGLLGRFYRSFPIAFPEGAWVKECLAHLTRTSGRAVSEIASVLDENDQLDVLADFLRKSVRNRTLSTELLIWICKERKGLGESVFDMDFGNAVLGALEDDHQAGGPKKTARLADAFADDKTLVGEMVADADEEELRNLAKRIMGTLVFDELTRRSLMGKIIKARPEMEKIMDEKTTARQDDSLIVSWESLERKKTELDDIVAVQIPANKQEIQIARAEGDLRENGGYKSAREHQAVLQRLQSKYERELRHARGTDFADSDTSRVGIGTIVEIEDLATHTKETYTVLGAWDSDPDKNIMAYLSESAKAMIGKKPGEEATLPTDTTEGSRKVKVLKVSAYVKA